MNSDYLALIKSRPDLFVNSEDPASIRIETEFHKIAEIERIVKERLRQKNLPESWGTIGFAFMDQYSTILRDAVTFPSGNVGTYIRNVQLSKEIHGTVILPKYKDKFILVNHYRHALRDWCLELPRGFGEKGISAVDNAKKELQEEIGANGCSITYLGRMIENSGFGNSDAFLFLAEVATIGDTETEEGIGNMVLVTEAELNQMIKNGSVVDSFTLSTWCYYLLKKVEGL